MLLINSSMKMIKRIVAFAKVIIVFFIHLHIVKLGNLER